MIPRAALPHVLAAALFVLAPGAHSDARAKDAPPPSPEERSRRIENGLLALAQAASDSAGREAQAATLSERMAFHHVPGVSVAVVDSFRLHWAKGYGLLKSDGSASATPGSRFEAASTSKAVVAAAVLHLVERGRLDLDADVNTYLRSWKVPDSDLTREHKVTLRLLLTHQAGLPATNMARDEGDPPTLVQILNGEPPARNKPAVVATIPGTQWEYSNLGYVVIQLLLEDVTGKPLARFMDETVFRPLGMRSSTFSYPLAPELRAEEAWPHDEEGTVCEPAMPPTALAQGGLITTPSDLARFANELMLAYQGRSERLLSRAMVREMLRPYAELDPRLLGMPVSDGLGILLHGRGRSLSFLHPGDNWPGATCWLVGHPETGQAAVVMTNGARGNRLAMEIVQAIAREYGWPQED